MDLRNIKFGCLKDAEDSRDRMLPRALKITEINSIDLRPKCARVKDQGQLGCCSAFGTTELFDFVRRKNNLINWTPSPLFTYYATRKYVGQQTVDHGASVRDALKSTVRDGVTKEIVWPYLIEKFAEEPSAQAWEDAEKHQTLQYLYIDSSDKGAILNCLNDGFPFIFGIKLYQSFVNSFETVFGGKVKTPDRVNEKLLGGHCMMAVGYQKNDDGTEFIIVQNSWGEDWGDKGFCYIPMEYFMSNDTFDFWTIRSTEVCDTDEPDSIPVPTPPAPTPEPVPTPVPTPVPAPVPAPTPEPLPTPVPTPVPTPTPEPLPTPEPKGSIWKNPYTYSVLIFVIFLLVFLFAK